MPSTSPNQRVFVIEDHSIMRAMLCEAVKRQPGFELTGTAKSAEEALDAIQEGQVDIALVDVSLPNMSGVEFVKALRTRAPKVACMMVSGHVEPMYVEQALEAGAFGYVLKGRAEDLAHALEACRSNQLFLSESFRHIQKDLDGPSGNGQE